MCYFYRPFCSQKLLLSLFKVSSQLWIVKTFLRSTLWAFQVKKSHMNQWNSRVRSTLIRKHQSSHSSSYLHSINRRLIWTEAQLSRSCYCQLHFLLLLLLAISFLLYSFPEWSHFSSLWWFYTNHFHCFSITAWAKGRMNHSCMHKDVSLPSCSCGGSWQSHIFSHNKKQSEPRKDVNRKAWQGVWPVQEGGSRMQTVLARLRCAERREPAPADPMPCKQRLLVAKEALSGQSQVVFCGQSIVLCDHKSGKDFHSVLAKRIPTLISK